MFEGWEGAILAVTGLALLLGRSFGTDFWRFIENIKETGAIPSGFAGLVANLIGLVFFGAIGAGVALFTGSSVTASVVAGALVGFLISLRANEVADEKDASANQALPQTRIVKESDNLRGN